ncbi:MAG TPA: hypothetical protein VNK95_22685, partial [Caldilineaceae bacterium]|nr:hypothetical protein [Caldilineaceae bacterium]
MPSNEQEHKPSTNSGRTAALDSKRGRSVSHPRYTLEQAERLAKAAFDIGPRNCDQDRVAQRAGYSRADNGAYKSLRAAAVQFGLVTISESLLSVSEEWIHVFDEDDPTLYRRARQGAMRRPPLYQQLLEDYDGRQLPNVQRLAQQLHINQKYGIRRDAASTAATVFLESARYAGILNDRDYIEFTQTDETPAEEAVDDIDGWDSRISRANEGGTRSRLETSKTSAFGQSYSDLASPPGLHRFEIPLSDGTTVLIFAPSRLPAGEKDRL